MGKSPYAFVFPRITCSGTSPAMKSSKPGPLPSSSLNFERDGGVEGIVVVASARACREVPLGTARSKSNISRWVLNNSSQAEGSSRMT